ncbi:MAG: PA0069 family radical SAM protein [Planctomycetes bacterium]|nr:PA0069 family radical SAM protein [Planctomycetota bacterium]
MRSVANPPNPWHSHHVELLEPPPAAPLQVFEEQAKSILSRNDSPDIPFTWSVNPYRGCLHGCAYCYARPSHQYLDFGAGTDFERKIVVKTNAADLLRAELGARSAAMRGEVLAFSGVTDCYQPLEASYGVTRACLQACRDLQQPVNVITKGALIERDVDLLAAMARGAGASVFVSIPFADAADARAIEPQAPSPERRLRTLATLAAAGVPVGVAVAPVIPGLNDHQVPAVLEQAKAAGASRAFLILLRLPQEVLPVFEERLRAAMPQRADKVFAALAEVRGGALQESRFGRRMVGEGPRWQAIEQLFRIQCARLGLQVRIERKVAVPRPRQLGLFGGS